MEDWKHDKVPRKATYQETGRGERQANKDKRGEIYGEQNIYDSSRGGTGIECFKILCV